MQPRRSRSGSPARGKGSPQQRSVKGRPHHAGKNRKHASPPENVRRGKERERADAADSGPKPGTTRMFATAVPGLAPLVRRELDALPGVAVTDTGFDGRSDVLAFDVQRGARPQLWQVHTLEDMFVEVGRTMRSAGDKAAWISSRIWRPERVQRALSVFAAEVRPLSAAMSFRVIARVLQEKSFLRTELRNQLSRAITEDKPKWRFDDPAQVEIWISEYSRGKFLAGLRLSDAQMRQHEGREVERSGALRPTVAAAMIAQVGTPGAVLLDPCCGSGTILSEALAAGWDHVHGIDIDAEAVEVAARNVTEATIRLGDARRLDLAEASADACVSNLPFGRQYSVGTDLKHWLDEMLGEIARILRPGGRVVLLAPAIPKAAIPTTLRLADKHPLTLLGTKTTLWVFDRT